MESRLESISGGRSVSAIRKWLAVSGLAILQALGAQDALAQNSSNAAIFSAWNKGDMATVRGLCNNVKWLSPYMPPELVLYCAKDAGDPFAMGVLGHFYMTQNAQHGFKLDLQQALYWSTESAKRGNGLGMFNLAVIHYEGLGVPKSLAKASQWCESAIKANVQVDYCKKIGTEAAAQGLRLPPTASALVGGNGAPSKPTGSTVEANMTSPEAIHLLARRYDRGDGIPQDTARASELYRQAADMGYARSQYNLGVLYQRGEGIPKDTYLKDAAVWYRKAAEQGHADAQNNLGVLLQRGDGVPKDIKEAAMWYQKAATEGNAAAQDNLGSLFRRGEGVPKDLKEAARWYRMAADQGYAAAQDNLGSLYRRGEGVPKDLKEAVKWYRKAADQVLAAAQNNLGVLYQLGEGVPKDLKEAARWYRMAANQGYAAAQNNLGSLYTRGDGVPQDFIDAAVWYRKAAEQGLADAQNNLGVLLQRGDGVPKDLKEAAMWYEKAAMEGNAFAQYNLGMLYRYGEGVSQDWVRAAMWYRKAGEQGNKSAQRALATIREDELNEKNARAEGLREGLREWTQHKIIERAYRMY